MQQLEERWQRLAHEVGLANATRLIMAEHPGQGDSVKELDTTWEGMDVLQIYEAIIADKSLRPVVSEAVELWRSVEAGANTLETPMVSPVEPLPTMSCNSWPQSWPEGEQ